MKNTGLLRPLVLALLLALSALLLPCSSALAEVVYCDWNESKDGAVFYVYLESEDENGQWQSVQTIVATGDVSLNDSKSVEATCLEDGKFVYDVSNIVVINELTNLDYSGTIEMEML